MRPPRGARALAPGFASARASSGSPDAALATTGEPPTVEALEARLDEDLERGNDRRSARTSTTSRSARGDRDLRSFGSQGEQRLAVLALLLAEAELLAERRGAPPLLLLDDVLSELDAGRRARARRAARRGGGQTLVTATDAAALPLEPAQLLEVTPGAVRAR